MKPWVRKALALFERRGLVVTSRLGPRGVVEFAARCHPSEIPPEVLEYLDVPESELVAGMELAGSGAWVTFEAREPTAGGRTVLEALAEGRAADRAIRKVMSRGYDKGAAIAILKSRRVICQDGRHLKRCSESTEPSRLPTIYRAGKSKISAFTLDLITTEGRDAGWYGSGLYFAESAEYVARWYGPIVTAAEIVPTARVLRAAVSATGAPPETFEAVIAHETELLRARGEGHRIGEITRELLSNHVEWVHAVDRMAEARGYDVVWFSPQEIVVKSLSAIRLLWSGKP